jgi:hypothetical protein
VWGKPDPSLEDTVNGILKFMYRKGIISVAAREVNAVSPICAPELTIEAHRGGIDCGADCLQCMATARDPECIEEIPKIEAPEQV